MVLLALVPLMTLVAGALALVALFQPDDEAWSLAPPEPAVLITPPTLEVEGHECLECHEDVVREWAGSAHGLSWVDEAYHEYVTHPEYKSAAAMSLEVPNVFVTRTFSKCFGMAGMRVGFAIAHRDTAANLRRYQLGFNTSTPTVAGAYAGLISGMATFVFLHSGIIEPSWFGPLGGVAQWLKTEAPNPFSCAAIGELMSVGTTWAVSRLSQPLSERHIERVFGPAEPVQS